MSEYEKWKKSTQYYGHAFSSVVEDAFNHQQAKVDALCEALHGLMMHFLADESGQLPPDLYDSPFYNKEIQSLYLDARAALAKARGES